MSLYGLILVLVMNIIIIIAGMLGESYDSITVAVIMVVFTWWKIMRMARVEVGLPAGVNITGC